MDGAGLPGPTWTILIPTLGQRRLLFERLLSVLLPQLDMLDGQVRVLAWWNNGTPRLAEIRQGLVDATKTEYLSFVDDDDMVPDYFVAETMQALQSRPDFVGWQTQYYVNDVPRSMVYHSLRYRRWWQDRDGMYRDVTHINPMRTDVARRGDFRRAGPGRGEDRIWVEQVRRYLRTEVVIDRIMYHYLFDEKVSAWRRPEAISQGPFRPAVFHSPHFSYHPGSSHVDDVG